MSKKFYDTNALLKLQEKSFDELFICSSKTLEEIEHIKVSDRKDQEVKFRARKLAHLLDLNNGKYEVVVPNDEIFSIIDNFELEVTPDNIIMACAYFYNKSEKVKFISNDICCKIVAKNVFKLDVESVNESKDIEYTGFIEKIMTDEDINIFYNNLTKNTYELLINQYLVLKNNKNEVIDIFRWDGETYVPLHKKPIRSISFGDKLKAKDVYQEMVIDSIMKNTITAISGKAGSGKSLLSLMTAMYLVDCGKYDRLVIMFNPTKTKGASDLGFYSGTFLDKAMQNSIGQILTTKFGDRYIVDTLMQQEKIKLVSMADVRGMEVKDNEILYITECQNTSVELLKLCLSRASAECKIIIEGDYKSQVDSYLFDGDSNGLKRVVEVLKGEDIFGYVELQNVWRSKIASLVDKF